MTDHGAGGRFQGKVAVVSGASHDPSIGRAIATMLGREGARLVINGRGQPALDEAEHGLAAQGIEVRSVVGSMEDTDTAARMVDCATGAFGGIDLVVNTVGGSLGEMAPLSISRQALMDTIALNTWSSLGLVQEAVRGGLAAGGSVVSISSGTVNKTTPVMIAYAAAKSALNAITRTLARDLGPRGIRVNGVAPGLTRTSATRAMWEADGGRAAGANLVLGRLTEADDIAHAAVFLLSEQARQITGVVINVDGGNHLLGGGWSPITQATSDRDN